MKPVPKRPREPWELTDDEFDELERYAEAVEAGWIPELDISIHEMEDRRNQAIAYRKDRRRRCNMLFDDFIDGAVCASTAHRPSKSAIVLYMFLLRLANRDGIVSGRSLRDIHKRTGLSTTSVRKAIDELQPRWLEVYSEDGKSPVYRLLSMED